MRIRSLRLFGVLSLLIAALGAVMASPALAHPPDCTRAKASPNLLWPPNHKFRLITVTVPDSAVDIPPNPNTVTILGVTQDEPLESTGDGHTIPDAATGPSSNKVYLRAERKGNGDGRVYRISFQATDINGTCYGTVTVGVPHDMGPKGRVPIDSGLIVNSFG
jgi:hypothetical protein